MPTGKLIYRAVFISDLHLGSAGFRAAEFCDFIQRVDCEHLYLVGDVVDAWVGGKTAKWRPDHERAMLFLLRKSSPSCWVRYTPGNHDAVLRRFNGLTLAHAEIAHDFVHTTTTGRRLLVVHGDLHDHFVTTYKPVAWAMAWLYEYFTRWNGSVNRGRRMVGLEPTMFAGKAKKKVKAMAERRVGFQDSLVNEAVARECHGVVCGHIHQPDIIARNDGLLYVNTGDWVENATFVVEHYNGELELISWEMLRKGLPDAEPQAQVGPEQAPAEDWKTRLRRLASRR